MNKIVKQRRFWFFVLFCLVLSAVLIVLNISQIKRFQLTKRNEVRIENIDKVVEGVKDYVSNNKNLPTTSNPSNDSFLPEIIFINGTPSGGVPISTLEDVNGYDFDTNMKDPNGSPYFIGTFENKIVVYTNEFENKDSFSKEIYFKSIEIDSTQEIQSKL